ncbi:MAG: IS630 family transposase [Alistipes senegalensis]|nr:IS630 family transposase [Alistipes senegalensis]
MRAAERKDRRVKKQRKKWNKKQRTMKKRKIIFLDECGINTNMTRYYGRAKGKKRVYDYVPAKRIKRTTLLSSVRLDGTLAYTFFQGALTGKIFLDYIRNILVPTLNKGDIVIMDNLSCHKVKGVAEAIENAGATVLYLPPYSPDLNPIEMMWSKIKSLLRTWKARSSEVLNQFIEKALSAVTTENIDHWFSACGYY